MAKRSLLVIPQITSTCLIPRMTQHENLKFLPLRRGEKRQVIKMTYSHVLSHHHHLGAHLLVLFVLKWIISHHFIVKRCFKNTCRIPTQTGLGGWGGVCICVWWWWCFLVQYILIREQWRSRSWLCQWLANNRLCFPYTGSPAEADMNRSWYPDCSVSCIK